MASELPPTSLRQAVYGEVARIGKAGGACHCTTNAERKPPK